MQRKIFYNYIHKILASIVILCAFSSCKKTEESEYYDSPIVESYLNPGEIFTFNVSRQIPFDSNVKISNDDINKLSIEVNDGVSSHILTPISNGNYIDSSIIVAENKNYTATFLFNSKTVKASTYIPSKPKNFKESTTTISLPQIDDNTPHGGFGGTQPNPIVLTWDNPDNSYYLVLIENIEPVLVPIRNLSNKPTTSSKRFRKSPTNINTQEIRTLEFQYFGNHRIILFHVLPDYASLYTSNTTNSQNLTNPSTSITNGYGIFTGLNSDTLYLDIKKQ